MAPVWLAGTVTVVALVGLGIFVYPWLLTRRSGAVAVAAITAALAVLFYLFDRRDDPPLSAALALLWAAGPVLAGVIVYRIQRR